MKRPDVSGALRLANKALNEPYVEDQGELAYELARDLERVCEYLIFLETETLKGLNRLQEIAKE